MTLVPLDDPGDERLADYVQLREVNLRRLLEEEHGLFIAEGDKVIRRAADAGYEPRSFLLAPRWLESLADVLAQWPETPVYVVSEDLAEQVTGFHVHRGALASYKRQKAQPLAELLTDTTRRIAIFDDIVDHTNVGAGFRAAAAMGVGLVLVTPTCADPLYRRSIKVSMGTVFQVPWTRLASWPGDLQVLQDRGFTAAAFALTEDSITLDELVARQDERLAVIFGTEGHGLKPHVLEKADLTVRIPMAGGVDSLNVASSAAVAFYATRT
ncbi:tRNA G18 (ribose-2'-O)-methylase SpoU [Kribbella antiqua]|uniref:tRNA G18 (Ribose-2'-O)-methylase SpoU n=1 Tax=Kribbella antiqua TaxID=2512217 RepID=A0A4V2S4Y3_9ACTN|nr:RNA methyltransferase [Kribbella antiqua]TCO49980.1 tRNA G18 (ribose-2'-O)-methylase SpoU [Kribbella antiqua]